MTNETDELQPRWTPVFERIGADKQKRVLDCAKRAFARYGFAGTNVNRVAEDAGISVGSLYKYFRTKDDLFLSIIEESHSRIEDTINGILASTPNFFPRVEAILEAAIASSQDDPDLVRLYLACTTDELSGLAERLSGRIESVSATLYRGMVAEAITNGEIYADADPASTAFCLDDIFTMVQFSFASSYYRERLRLFVGQDALDKPATLIDSTMKFIRRALAK